MTMILSRLSADYIISSILSNMKCATYENICASTALLMESIVVFTLLLDIPK